MLTHRTNVLFTKSDYQRLSALAKQKGTTMADLIRKAIKTSYFKKEDTSRQQLVKDIKKGWGFLKHPEIPLDYKQLINDGRKY